MTTMPRAAHQLYVMVHDVIPSLHWSKELVLSSGEPLCGMFHGEEFHMLKQLLDRPYPLDHVFVFQDGIAADRRLQCNGCPVLHPVFDADGSVRPDLQPSSHFPLSVDVML
jgi:hypothetical protein